MLEMAILYENKTQYADVNKKIGGEFKVIIRNPGAFYQIPGSGCHYYFFICLLKIASVLLAISSAFCAEAAAASAAFSARTAAASACLAC